MKQAVIEKLIERANDPQHEGAGFALVLGLQTGRVVRVYPTRHPFFEGSIIAESSLLRSNNVEREEIAVDLDAVVSAYIDWD